MKKIFQLMMIATLALLSNSCLEKGLKDLEVFEGKEINTVYVAHRYYGEDKIPVSGQPVVKQHLLQTKVVEKDAEKGVFTVDVIIPSNLPKSQVGKVVKENLVVMVVLSSAATIEPIGDAPKLGVPGNWSKPNQYTVRAADGSTQVWTITLRNI
ncbi:MAG: hypothetical protein MR396_01915 [Phocaeicola sp.]|nr:hypothetical protein [Phocaeicola sp.]